MEKRVLRVGRGLYYPNEQARVVVDLLGKWQTFDGAEHIFDNRGHHSITIGRSALFQITILCIFTQMKLLTPSLKLLKM